MKHMNIKYTKHKDKPFHLTNKIACHKQIWKYLWHKLNCHVFEKKLLQSKVRFYDECITMVFFPKKSYMQLDLMRKSCNRKHLKQYKLTSCCSYPISSSSHNQVSGKKLLTFLAALVLPNDGTIISTEFSKNQAIIIFLNEVRRF